MRTLAVQVKDAYIQDFLNYVQEHSSNISITKDTNSILDPYFVERQEKLHKIRNDAKNGNMRLLTQEESNKEVELFFKEL
ncbi:MAG: hypothetical protein RBR07_01445 [Arcobacteraceae bacterium]|nr:hypothetical protein [Arcobacteraceae bacterium]